MSGEMKPEYLWFNGEIISWQEAKVHVWSELAIRGASVFDGIRAYWNETAQSYNLLAVDEHLQRLFQSADLLRFPRYLDVETMKQAIIELLNKLDYREHTSIRPTLFIEDGRYAYKPENTKMGAYIVAFPVPHARGVFFGIRCCVSSWRRLSELSFSPRIKAGAAYMALRLPRIEGMMQGMDDVIFLNDRDTVSEASGAAIFVIRNGKVYTPPVYSDILESITRQKLINLFKNELGIDVIEREIARTELYTADEVFICGTLCELQPVIEIDHYLIGDGKPGTLTVQLRDRFFEIVEKGHCAPEGWLTPVLPSVVRQG